MLKNYLKIAIRNLVRHKSFSLINISGLAIGIASVILLFTVVRYELSYDTFQPNYQQIYRVVTEDKRPDDVKLTSGIPFPALEALQIDFPEATVGAYLANYGSQVTVLGSDASTTSNKKFIEETGFLFADPQIFRIFHYDWLVGDPSVLNEPNTTVLTQKTAEKYFGDWKQAPGKFLKLDNKVIVKVAGILRDIPANTDFPLSIVSSLKTARTNPDTYFYSEQWNSTTSNFQVYMLLPKKVSEANVNNRLLAFSEKNYNNKRVKRTNFLQPLSDIHFNNKLVNFGDHTTNKSTLLTLSLIGLFILVMACINFINLSTAQAVDRSKEVGIRKVLGSYRRQLFMQILGETAFLVLASVVLAFAIAEACLPYIKNVALINESLSLFNWPTILFLIGVSIVVIALAGTYPAIVLSGFKPALALKNKITSATVGGISVRRSLVVIQFSIAQILIIGTIVAVSQMNFVKNADLGFSRDAVLLFNANADSVVTGRQTAFKERLLQLPGVESVSFNRDAPSSQNSWNQNFAFDHKSDENFNVSLKFADEDYFTTFGIQFLAGRPFDKSDTVHQLVINEMLAKELGLQDPSKAVGKEIRLGGGGWKTITGVVKNFKTGPLTEPIQPTVIAENKGTYGVTAIKLHSSNIPKTKASIEDVWNQYFPEYAYTTSFMDENIAQFYQQEDQLALLYKIFAGIAIFISCLGLYGLVSFMAIQKTKEIGVRKVLGASVKNIVYLFSKEFTILIVTGSLIAVPVAYYMMNHWLQNFTFRIRMNVWIFLAAIVASVIIAWIAVGYKSVKAALANPVKSLRSE
jgi:predicted permease